MAALVGVGPTMMLSKSIVLTAWRQGIISSMTTCHPRSSRRIAGCHTDFRRLYIIRGITKTTPTKMSYRDGSTHCMAPLVVFETTCRIATTRRISSSFGYDRFRTVAYKMSIHQSSCDRWILLVLGDGVGPPKPGYKAGILPIN